MESQELIDWLQRAELVPENTRSVVIKSSAGMPVTIYATLTCPRGVIEVEPPPEFNEADVFVTRPAYIQQEWKGNDG
jgi:hypothetical protein